MRRSRLVFWICMQLQPASRETLLSLHFCIVCLVTSGIAASSEWPALPTQTLFMR